MANLEDILTCPDLLLLVTRYTQIETVIELLRVSKGVYSAAKAYERHICNHFSNSSFVKIAYLQTIRDETGTDTFFGLSRLRHVDLTAALSSIGLTNPPYDGSLMRFCPFEPSHHLCNITPKTNVQRSVATNGTVFYTWSKFLQWEIYAQTSEAISLLCRLSRAADTVRSRSSSAGSVDRSKEAQAMLEARRAILQHDDHRAIRSFYRLRVILLTHYVHGVNTGLTTHACSCSARLWGWLMPSFRVRSCSCTMQVRVNAVTGNTEPLLTLSQTRMWSGRRMDWAQSQGTWLSRCFYDVLPSLISTSNAHLGIDPVTFDLFDPWTLWWFLDGDDFGRGIKLLQQVWQTRRMALEQTDTGNPHNVLSPATSNCYCKRWDTLWFRDCTSGYAAPVDAVHLSTHTICSLVWQCHQAWKRATQEEKMIGREMGRQLAEELSLERFTFSLGNT